MVVNARVNTFLRVDAAGGQRELRIRFPGLEGSTR